MVGSINIFKHAWIISHALDLINVQSALLTSKYIFYWIVFFPRFFQKIEILEPESL